MCYDGHMSNLTPSEVQQLVAKAFVLEAMSDKPGCTTRYEDLPGKPLQDFVIAGINSSAAFGDFAHDFIKDSTTPVFKYNVQALKISNTHKSTKFINFGLLEIMFPTVAARLTTNNPKKVVDEIIKLVKHAEPQDVQTLLATRQLAWSTSQNPSKTSFETAKYKEQQSVWDFYQALNQNFDEETSNYQWSQQFKEGLPLLRAFFDDYQQADELLNTTTSSFNRLRKENSNTSVGILADMCAAAMFLWLSFHDSPV